MLGIRPEMKVDLEMVLELGNGPRNGSDEVVPERKTQNETGSLSVVRPNGTGSGMKANRK